MRQITFASLIVLGLTATAFANEVPIPNGRFDADAPGSRYTQTITSWVVSGPGAGNANLDPVNGAPAYPIGVTDTTQLVSGVFNTYSTYLPTGSNNFLAMVNNLGVGTTTFTNSTPFLVSDDVLQFNYAYLTGDAPGTPSDNFGYQIDFFSDAGGTVNIGSSGQIILANEAEELAFVGGSPFNISTTYTGPQGPSDYGVEFLEIAAFRGSYARVSFFIDNANATSNAGNGYSVSGFLLENVVIVPEPASLALFGLGVVGFGGLARRRRRRKLAAK